MKNKDGDADLINELEIQLEAKVASKAEGARLRAKVTWYEQGEKSTKYFYNLENKRARQTLWIEIKGSDGRIKTHFKLYSRRASQILQ